MAWKDIPEKKVLATLKDGKSFKGVAAEKMTIYVDGGVPGGEGDVQGVSVTVDPNTYVMTTQLKDGKGGNVGSPATVDLPLESMVVGGEYDDATKKVILTLKNGETVEFSVADLVAGLQSEITSQNPLSADLIAETSNKNFVTNEEKEDISSISGLADDVETLNANVEGLQSDDSGLNDDVNNLAGDVCTLQGDVSALQSDLGSKQDIIDENNPLNADYIDDGSSEKKLVTAEEKNAIEQISQGDASKIATLETDGPTVNIYNQAGYGFSIGENQRVENGEPTGLFVNLPEAQVVLERGEAQRITTATYGDMAYVGELNPGTYTYNPQDGTILYIDDDETTQITEAGTLIIGEGNENGQTVFFVPTDNSDAKTYYYNRDSGEVEEKTVANTSAIPTRVGQLTNDSGYQTASQVSSAIASAVGGITSFEYQVVSTLPQTGEAGVIYLLANSGTTPNLYDEYIWVNNAFEKIGTTEIDLSNYVTNDDLHDYTASTLFVANNGIEISDGDGNSMGVTIEEDATTGNPYLTVTGPDGSFNVPNVDDVTSALAGKADAIDPADLPSGSTQNGVITTSNHTNIDPAVVDEGQIIVDSTDGKVYIVSEITTDPQTGDPVIIWKEVQTDKEVVYANMTITDVQAMTFVVNDYTATEIHNMLNAGMSVFYRLTLPQAVGGLAAGVYDFRPIYHTNGAVMSSLSGSVGNNSLLGIAYHTDVGTPYIEMRILQNQIDSNNKLSADLIDSSSSDEKTYQTGTGAPTTSSEGSVGEIYVDKSTGKVYVCTSTTGGTYTWTEVSGTQVQVDWGQSDSTAVDFIKNKPTIPTVNDGTLTIQKNGTTVQTFSANASSNKTVNLDIPTITMQTTDPGEGVSLAANNFIAVYEA